MKPRELLQKYEKLVVIAHYLPQTACQYNGGFPPQNPAIFLQVTLDASKISRSGNFIRLGETKGDEINGWTNLDWLEVSEILGELGADGATVTPISEAA